ncbi:MAG: serine/threonine protein kinase [Solirubrobacteraceae bacterium]
MQTVLLQVPAPDDGPPVEVRSIGPAQTLRFGRGAPDCAVDIELPHDSVSRLAGEIGAVEDEFARVSLPVTEGPVSFLVFAPQHCYADPSDPDALDGESTAAAFPLDETAKYFLILVALCEPRLRDSSTVALPTADEIVERLRAHDQCSDLTRTAVNHHIDYLATTKLRVKEPQPGAGKRLDFKREALVSIALRYGLVREEHRRLLSPRSGGGI